MISNFWPPGEGFQGFRPQIRLQHAKISMLTSFEVNWLQLKRFPKFCPVAFQWPEELMPPDQNKLKILRNWLDNSQKFPANFPDIYRTFLVSFPEISRTIQETSWEFPGSFPNIFWTCPGNILGHFSENFRGFSEIFAEISVSAVHRRY